MSTFRVCKDKDNPYVMLNKKFLRDIKLSAKAKGILAYLLSLPDDWQIYENELVNNFSDGRDSISSGIKELIKFGYIERVSRTRDEKGRLGAYDYKVHEVSIHNGNSDMDNHNGKSYVGKSKVGKPKVGKSATTNNNLTNNDNTDNDRTEKEAALSSNNLDKFFNSIKTEMLSQGLETAFNNFIKDLNINKSENKIIIEAPNDFIKTMVENKFKDLIEIHLKKYFKFNDLEVISTEKLQVNA